MINDWELPQFKFHGKILPKGLLYFNGIFIKLKDFDFKDRLDISSSEVDDEEINNFIKT